MTNEEAIKQLKERYDFGKKEYSALAPQYIEALKMAIESLQENTKLKAEIEQLKEVRNKYGLLFEMYDKKQKEIERLKLELEQSVRLPYPIDTPIYFAYSKQGVVKDRIRRWQINKNGLLFNSKGSAFLPDAIGKSIFLSQEEAEQSLKATQP